MIEFWVFGRRREIFLSREIGEKWDRNRMDPIYRKSQFLDGSRGIERYRELKTRVLSIEELSRIYQEVSTAKGSQWIKVAIKKLSSIQKVSRWIEVAIENAIKGN